MKAFLISIFIFLPFTSAFSQTSEYHAFPHDNAEWSSLFGYTTIEPIDTIYFVEKYHSGGDSIIAGDIYIKIMAGTGLVTLLKDDTLNKKVYELYDNGIDLVDTILYDFNLSLGASVTNSIEFLDYPTAHVTAVDSIYIDDNYRKRLKIKYTNGIIADSTYWIEGIGSTNGIQLGPHDLFEFPVYRKLICYEEFDEVLFSDLEDWYDCDSVLIQQGPFFLNNFEHLPIAIHPNPVGDYVFISGEQNVINQIYSVQLIRIDGTIVASLNIDSDNLISIPRNISPGFYVLIILTKYRSYPIKIVKR
ncbi:MAG: T9SS type A sorting domain-containing protein [Chitinophagales bacterium]